MSHRVTETFFPPDEVGRKNWTLPADIYNLSHTLFARSEYNCVFVPIRSMQYLSIVTATEIVFVDSQAYAYHRNEGGRLIMLVWKFDSSTSRESLNDPIPCQVIQYHADSELIQLRLVGAYRKALGLVDQRYRDSTLPADGARIVSLK